MFCISVYDHMVRFAICIGDLKEAIVKVIVKVVYTDPSYIAT